MLKDAFFSALAVVAVVAVAAVVGPCGPTMFVDPSMTGANPRPEWPFLWLFALLSLSPPEAETFIILVFPVILVVALLLVPFVSATAASAPPAAEKADRRAAVVVIYAVLAALTYEGATAPWSPHMTAWSSTPVPVNVVRRCSPVGAARGRWSFRTRTVATATPWKAGAAAAART